MQKVFESYLNSEPMSHLWALMLLAQHSDYLKSYESALGFIEQAIKHTPTLHELYLVKAKILKHQRDYVQAAEVADYARKLDLADRYLNNKAVKYALRAHKVYYGQELLRMFLRDSQESNPHDIQTIWYELAVGEAFLDLGYLGPSIRMFKFIYQHYIEMYEDQIDFY